MTISASSKPRVSILRRLLGWLLGIIGFICKVLITAWGTLAIYFSNLPWSWLRISLACAFAVFSIWTLWVTRRRRRFLLFAAVFALLYVWWSLIPPSHDRAWRTEVAILPRAYV